MLRKQLKRLKLRVWQLSSKVKLLRFSRWTIRQKLSSCLP